MSFNSLKINMFTMINLFAQIISINTLRPQWKNEQKEIPFVTVVIFNV